MANAYHDDELIFHVQKRPFRYHPGTVALREIRRYQRTTELFIRKKTFSKIVREIMCDLFPEEPHNIQASALEALQEVTEAWTVAFLASRFAFDFVYDYALPHCIAFTIRWLTSCRRRSSQRHSWGSRNVVEEGCEFAQKDDGKSWCRSGGMGDGSSCNCEIVV